MKKYLLLFFILIAYLPLFSDNIEFIAEAKQTVSTGEQFALVYTINAQGSNFRAPALRDFNMLSGPSTSSSTSVQWINGQMSQSVTISYTYILQA
ncbi:MAG: BatD family protein, partial [Bacteroidales bacterium]|nr:BatD family protein [Bacteroidales bacterium]